MNRIASYVTGGAAAAFSAGIIAAVAMGPGSGSDAGADLPELRPSPVSSTVASNPLAATATSTSTSTNQAAAAPAAVISGGQPVQSQPVQSRDIQVQASDIQTFQAGSAGTVMVRNHGTSIELVAVDTNAGWTATIDRDDSGREIKVWFASGAVALRFEAELVGGQVRTEVDNRSDDNSAHGRDDEDDRGGGDDSRSGSNRGRH